MLRRELEAPAPEAAVLQRKTVPRKGWVQLPGEVTLRVEDAGAERPRVSRRHRALSCPVLPRVSTQPKPTPTAPCDAVPRARLGPCPSRRPPTARVPRTCWRLARLLMKTNTARPDPLAHAPSGGLDLNSSSRCCARLGGEGAPPPLLWLKKKWPSWSSSAVGIAAPLAPWCAGPWMMRSQARSRRRRVQPRCAVCRGDK